MLQGTSIGVGENDLAVKYNVLLGQRIRSVRLEQKLTLQDVVARTGLAASTLSKIENGRLSVTYDKLVTLSRALGVDLPDLVSNDLDTSPTGRRAVTRCGDGSVFRSPQYTYEMLCAEIAGKRMIPLLTHVEARDLAEFGPLVSHEGEEFVFVLKRRITLHTEFYEPMLLDVGDSVYFDSGMGHALTCAEGDGQVLWISTLPLQHAYRNGA